MTGRKLREVTAPCGCSFAIHKGKVSHETGACDEGRTLRSAVDGAPGGWLGIAGQAAFVPYERHRSAAVKALGF